MENQNWVLMMWEKLVSLITHPCESSVAVCGWIPVSLVAAWFLAQVILLLVFYGSYPSVSGAIPPPSELSLMTTLSSPPGSHRKTRSARNAWSWRPSCTFLSLFFLYLYHENWIKVNPPTLDVLAEAWTLCLHFSGSPRKGGASWRERTHGKFYFVSPLLLL